MRLWHCCIRFYSLSFPQFEARKGGLYGNAKDRDADRSQTRRRQLQLALAVDQFRLDHGALPESAGQLVPVYFKAIPGDPWKPGTSISYTKAGSQGGFRLTSGNGAATLEFPALKLE